MNNFDRAVNKKLNELISKNLLGEDVYVGDFKKFKVIAKAIIREESRGLKPNDNPKSLYSKTWKAARKYGEIKK
ncbi:MAG: hypothetical protein H7Y18_00565 [Clostridiaceae bacterium]|nr:hypothetical protein [Clostridiaceae bacterium]